MAADGPGATSGSLPAGAPSPPASTQPASVLYLDDSSLRRFVIDGGKVATVGKLEASRAVAQGGRIAYVGSGTPEEGDFLARPELHLWTLESNSDKELGPGFSPLWRPGGGALAYLRPLEERSCDAETCTGDSEVVAFDVTTGEGTVLLPGGRWSLLTWAGEDLLVADLNALDATVRVSPSASRTELAVTPSEVWGASPDGRLLVRARLETAETIALGPRGLGKTIATIDLGGRRLAEGTWSEDSKRVAAVLLDVGPAGGLTSELAVIDAAAGGVHEVPGTSGATGPVLWGPGNDSVLAARSVGRSGGRLEAVSCRAQRAAGCDPLFTWKLGVTLLALE